MRCRVIGDTGVCTFYFFYIIGVGSAVFCTKVCQRILLRFKCSNRRRLAGLPYCLFIQFSLSVLCEKLECEILNKNSSQHVLCHLRSEARGCVISIRECEFVCSVFAFRTGIYRNKRAPAITRPPDFQFLIRNRIIGDTLCAVCSSLFLYTVSMVLAGFGRIHANSNIVGLRLILIKNDILAYLH